MNNNSAVSLPVPTQAKLYLQDQERGLHFNVLELVGTHECIEATVPDNSNLELNLDNNVVRYVLLRMVFNG